MITPEPEFASPALPRLGPVTPAERVEILDIFRGFALLGVLVANMRGFSGPMMAYFDHTLMWQEPANRAAQFVVDAFVSGKFITIFSFLFGVGFAIQMERAEARPAGFLGRRFGALMALGLVHIFLLWWGDILLAYSVFGFALLLFRRREPKTLLWWAAVLYLFPLLGFGMGALAAHFNPEAMKQPPADPAELARLIRVYATGGYGQILIERAKEAGQALMFVPFFGPRLLGLFLLGTWVWRRGILQGLANRETLLRRCQLWGFAVGLPLGLGGEVFMLVKAPVMSQPSLDGLVYFAVNSVAVPALSAAYLATVARLGAGGAGRKRVHWFAPVGRMALTNYLTQTVVCTMIFYGYGLGWFGKVGPIAGLGLALAIYGAQMGLSRWWLGRWRQGPAEAAWRWVTYAGWRRD
ncbi:MAG TPA: DUF418 domain-containing protein [Bryobacteraceae bacterium]|nr:DUF418 domain-containing protein [Bryobacteraceae bacterium]